MKNTRNTSRFIGILFLTVMLSWGAGYVIINSLVSAPDFLVHIYPEKSRLIMGVLFEIIEIAAVMGIALLLYPILRTFRESTARAYLSFRILESVMLITGALAALLLIPVSREYLDLGITTRETLSALSNILLDLRDRWSFLILTPMLSISALLMNWAFYKTGLLPRWLAIWGFSAAILVLINQVLEVQMDYPLVFLPGALMGTYEIFLGIWLLVRGFKSPD